MGRQLEEINASGELVSINLGGVAAENAVPTKADILESIHNTASFIPAAAPAYVEGKVFYDDNDKTLCYYNEVNGVKVNMCGESLIRVVNLTGLAIVDGKPVRHDGVDAVTGLPKIALAKADTLTNSRVLGVATHTINNGAVGYITAFGVVHDIDTSALATGVPVYLSATTAGALTTTAPDIMTQVGGCLVSDASVGQLFVSIMNHVTLPPLFGVMTTIPPTPVRTVPATWTDIIGYTVEDSVVLTTNGVTGRMTMTNSGWYRVTFSTTLTVTDPPPSGTDVINFRLYNVTQATTLFSTTVSITSTSAVGSRSAVSPVPIAAAGDVVVMQIQSSDTATAFTYDLISFDMESISII